MKKQCDSHVIKIKSQKIDPCETHVIKLSGKDFKASIKAMLKDINTYIKKNQ